MSAVLTPTDRRLTYGVIIAVIVHFAAILIWAGGAAARLTAVETALQQSRDLEYRLTRVEAQLEGMSQQLNRIEQRLEDGQ